MSHQISPLSYIHPNAQIGKDVSIGPFSVIESDVIISDGTTIHSHVCILPGSRIGENCQIFQGAVIGSIPQDLKFKGEYTTVSIGANTVIREFATINRGTAENGSTQVGNNCLIMAYVHIAHDCSIGNECILSNNSQLAGHVIMEDFAITGGMTGVLQFTRIGKYGFLSGGTLISKDIPPYAKVIYTPGNYAGLNLLRLRRKGMDAETIQNIADMYKLIYNSNMNLSQALSEIENTFPDSEEKQEILTFVKNSKNGVIKKYAKE